MYNWPIIRDIVGIFSAMLEFIHSFIPSYGWSIVVLTVIFRLLLLPLDIKSKVSMKKQALLQPQIAKINEKYKNDKEKAAQKTMELYKKEKASPLSGCLPSLIQMPLFIAFFGALNIIAGEQIFRLYMEVVNNGLNVAISKIEPWLWVHNVWQPDTMLFGAGGINFMGLNSAIVPSYMSVRAMAAFQSISEAQYNAVMVPLISRTSEYFNGWFILPILAGVTSWWQTKITMPPQQPAAAENQPKNPLSGKTMQYIFPLISVYFTASSNSVFALYWITSNLVSIATFVTVDRIWKLREQKKELEGSHKPEQQAQPAITAASTGNKPANARMDGKSGAPAGNTNPREGKK